MPEGPKGHYFYDAKRHAADGRWAVIVKGSAVVQYIGKHTEAEARAEVGLTGGSTDSRYIPEEA